MCPSADNPKNTLLMKRIKIPQLLINRYSAKPGLKQARALAMWALMRKAYKDNTIRNYRGKLSYFSQLFGISEYVIRGLISEMERHGYATRINGNLKMVADHELAGKDCKMNQYLDGSDFGRLTKTIMAQTIISSITKQQHRIVNMIGKRFVKTWQKDEATFHKKNLADVEIRSYTNISNATFAKKSGNDSVAAGYKFKSELEKLGLIRTQKRVLVHGEFDCPQKAEHYRKYLCENGRFYLCRYNKDGNYEVFSHLSSAIYKTR